MTLYLALGDERSELTDDRLRHALWEVLERVGRRERVLALPPDFTRYHSRAGRLTCMLYDYYRDRLRDVMPALGTHVPMTAGQL